VTDAAAEQKTDQCDRQEGHSHRPVSREPWGTTAGTKSMIGSMSIIRLAERA
jgi:hypothetical protein